jgi:hypothetical protein
MMTVNLHAFSRVATNVADDRVLTLSGKKVQDTGRLGALFTSRAENRTTIAAFVGAVRKRYGDHIANMTKSLLSERSAAGKPLTARMAKDLIHLAETEKARVNAANRETVANFLHGNGNDPEKSLDKALDRFCAETGISGENRALLKEKATRFLVRKAEHNRFHPAVLTAETLFQNVASGRGRGVAARYSLNTAAGLLGREGAALPGTATDKLRLLDMGLSNGGSNVHMRAVHELPQMRAIQPNGPLTRETVWRALFNENLPEAVSRGDVSLGEAALERQDAECKALARATGARDEGMSLMGMRYMPWSGVESLSRRPDTLRLGEKGLCNIEGGISRQGDRAGALRSLRVDPSRVGADTASRTSSPPAYVFKHDDGSEERIQVGQNTDFFTRGGGEDTAGREAYLRGQDNPLSQHLASAAQEICGAGASEAQVTNVMLCLGQCALLPVRQLSDMAGASFNEHSHVDVTLSRQPDGTVCAEFDSPEELRDSHGHFHMVLDIALDGKMTAREFEISPNAAVRNARNIDEANRPHDVAAAVAPLLTSGDQAGGLGAIVRERAATLSPDAKVGADAIGRGLSTEIHEAMQQLARNRDTLPTPEEFRQVRDGMVDAFFSRLQTAAAEVPDAQRAQFTRACLERMTVLPPDVCKATAELAGPIADSLGQVAAARNADEARSFLEGLGTRIDTALQTANAARLAAGKPPLSETETAALRGTAIHMALNAMADAGMGDNRKNMESLVVRLLAREGGPFRDLLYELAHAPETDAAASGLLDVCGQIREEIASQVPPKIAARLDSATIGERNLSLAHQRQIPGLEEGTFVARGAQVDGVDFNATLRRDMPGIAENFRKQVEQDLRMEPPPIGPSGFNRGATGVKDSNGDLRPLFFSDTNRCGISVDGHRLPPGSMTNEQIDREFSAHFPDRRTAALLSNIANQSLQGMLYTAMNEGISDVEASVAILMNPDIAQREQHLDYRVDSQGQDSEGNERYRISAQTIDVAKLNAGSTERLMIDVSFDVTVGDPPTVTNPRVDILLRGRETVPGEALPPDAPPPSDPALRPPAPRT